MYSKVKVKLFSEKESLIWMVGSLLITLSPLFIKQFDKVSKLLGIAYPPSLLFMIAILFCLFLVFRLSQTLHITNEKLKELGQVMAMIDKRVREMENK